MTFIHPARRSPYLATCQVAGAVCEIRLIIKLPTVPTYLRYLTAIRW